MLSKRILLLILVTALVLLTACSDDDDDCPTCPDDTDAPTPTMANIWPHADGTSRIFAASYAVHEGDEPQSTPPPLPTMAEAHAALAQPVANDLISRDEGLYRTRFNGEVTTLTGVTAQNLETTYFAEVGGDPVPVAGGERGLLQTIGRLRPDLRPAIAQRLGAEPWQDKSLDEAGALFFLGSYAFAYEDTGYYGYGDWEQGHSWTYLEGDLSVGSEFSIQLLRGLANDIWLYGQVWSVGDVEVGGVTWPNAVEYLYLVDLGVQTVVNEQGEELGQARSYMTGITVFVPEVGPVFCHERHVFAADDQLQDDQGSLIVDYLCTYTP